jgi:hypothetical protein
LAPIAPANAADKKPNILIIWGDDIGVQKDRCRELELRPRLLGILALISELMAQIGMVKARRQSSLHVLDFVATSRSRSVSSSIWNLSICFLRWKSSCTVR